MRPETCPSEQQLQAFQLGDLPEPALDAVARHLETCPRCETLAQQLDAALDPIAAAIRNPPGQRPPALVSPPVPPPPRAKGSPAPPRPYPFLLPPVQPDEMGRLGSYRVLRLLGQGGMAYVFHAEDVALLRPVALKVMRPDLSGDTTGWQRFLREARIMAAIKHPHLVTVFQAGQEGKVFYLAMELLAGESLGAWMARQAPGDLAEILRLSGEITTGLAVVHGHGLVHRDIKPDNIWLEATPGNVKILDFGLARFVDDDIRLTRGGTVMGTPSFMSPEQAQAQAVDARSDLYSLGAVLYCLCTGRSPFQGKNSLALLAALVKDTPRPVHELNPAIPRALSDLVMQLLAKNPAQRPASAEEVLERIGEIEPSLSKTLLPGQPYLLPAPSLSGGTSRIRVARVFSRPAWVMALLGVLGIGLLAFAAWFLVWGPFHPSTVNPAEPGATYLSSLEVIEAVNWPFGGKLPFPPPAMEEPADWPSPQGGQRVRIRGKASPHGLWMHLPPPNGGSVRVIYSLRGRFRTFNAEVSLNDGPWKCIPMTFAVYGDGRLLWKSRPVSTQADTQVCTGLSVQGVDKLTLEVSGSGEVQGTHAVWIEPNVTE